MNVRPGTTYGWGLARFTIEADTLRLGFSLLPTSRHKWVARTEVELLTLVEIWWAGEFVGIVAPNSALHGYVFFAAFQARSCREALGSAGWS